MAAAAAVYRLGWFDAAMVHGEEGWVLGDSCCCMCWLYLCHYVMANTADGPFLHLIFNTKSE